MPRGQEGEKSSSLFYVNFYRKRNQRANSLNRSLSKEKKTNFKDPEGFTFLQAYHEQFEEIMYKTHNNRGWL